MIGHLFLVDGILHGDPHPGNILFDQSTHKMYFIDWGQAYDWHQTPHDLQSKINLCKLIAHFADFIPFIKDLMTSKQMIEGLSMQDMIDDVSLRNKVVTSILGIVDIPSMKKKYGNSFFSDRVTAMIPEIKSYLQKESRLPDAAAEITYRGIIIDIMQTFLNGFFDYFAELVEQVFEYKINKVKTRDWKIQLVGTAIMMLESNPNLNDVQKWKNMLAKVEMESISIQSIVLGGTNAILTGLMADMQSIQKKFNVTDFFIPESTIMYWKPFADKCLQQPRDARNIH